MVIRVIEINTKVSKSQLDIRIGEVQNDKLVDNKTRSNLQIICLIKKSNISN